MIAALLARSAAEPRRLLGNQRVAVDQWGEQLPALRTIVGVHPATIRAWDRGY